MKKTILSILILLILFGKISAEDNFDVLQKRPEGTEFWLCFMKNFLEQKSGSSTNDINLELFITGDLDAEVTIEIEKINFKKTIQVKGGTVSNVKLDPRAEITDFGEVVSGLAVYVKSDQPVSVYGLNTRFQTTDTFLGLPVNVLGNQYRVMSYHVAGELNSIFAVVATEDSTVLTIVPTVETVQGNKAGEPFVVELDKGDIYQTGAMIYGNNSIADLTGTLITSNKKISVFSGHQCAYVPKPPPRIIACNHLVEQLPPISSWGKHFYIGKFEKRSLYTYRILAHENDTKVFIDGNLIGVLEGGDYFEADDSKSFQITADKPVLVAQYSQGFKNGDLIGDPMMLLISPTQQFLSRYRFATPIHGSWDHYINVVVPNDNLDSLFLNGKNISKESFTQLGMSRYSIAHIKIPFGTHYIECDAPFGLYSYGFGFGEDAYDAYGNMVGQSFLEYVSYKDVLPPVAELNDINAIIFRDDRIDDSGIKSISVISSDNINDNIPNFSEATPYVNVDLEVKDVNANGSITFKVTDLFDNTAYYTICYKLDRFNKNRIFELNKGRDVSCFKVYKYEFGVFAKLSNFYHSANFQNTGLIETKGDFSDAVGSGGIAGISVSRIFNSKFRATLSLSIDNYRGTLISPDSTYSKIRDPRTGNLIDFQQSSEIDLNSYFLSSMFTAEYHLNNYFYGFAGFNTAIAISKSISHKQRIIIPESYVYDNGESYKELPPEKLNSICSFRLGVILGAGIKVPVSNRVSLFSNLAYIAYLSEMIDDGNWRVNQLSFMLGAKYLF